MAALVDIDIDQGADFTSDTFDWLDSTGAPVDLTGATATYKIKARVSDPNAPAIVSLTEVSGITLGGALGTVVFTIPAATTATIPQGQYIHNLIVVSGGVTAMLFSGVVFVRGMV